MITRTSAEGKELIKAFEGFAARPYICPAGYWTIGYGHLITYDDALPLRWRGQVLTEEMALHILESDLTVREKAVMRLVDVPLTQGQFDALVSFVYNLGAGRLQVSTLRRRLNRGDYDGVPSELGKWVYSKGQKLGGLVRRRAAEVIMWNA